MDDKLLSQLTDDEKQQIKDLKKQLDDGLITKMEFKAKRSALISKFKRSRQSGGRKALTIAGVAIAAVLIIYAVVVTNQSSDFEVSVGDRQIMSGSQISVVFDVTNTSSASKDAVCAAEAVDSDGNSYGIKTGINVRNVPANSSEARSGGAIIDVRDNRASVISSVRVDCR